MSLSMGSATGCLYKILLWRRNAKKGQMKFTSQYQGVITIVVELHNAKIDGQMVNSVVLCFIYICQVKVFFSRSSSV